MEEVNLLTLTAFGIFFPLLEGEYELYFGTCQCIIIICYKLPIKNPISSLIGLYTYYKLFNSKNNHKSENLFYWFEGSQEIKTSYNPNKTAPHHSLSQI